ncbi:MAG TPA: glycosyltransferase [Acidimicrobiales bacterium]|nr:glycosyltransferase [Acidimicrobiales bacterium]
MGDPRVLCLIDSLAPGGAERSLVEMAPRLVRLGVRLEVAVLADTPGLGPELVAGGVPLHVVGRASRASRLRRLAGLLASRRPGLLHTTLYESDVLGRIAAFPLRIPVVTTLANTPYGPEHAAEAGVSTARLRAAQVVDVLTARTVRRFHAVSRATAAACVQRLRLDPAKVEVIPRGRDQGRLGRRSPQRSAAARRSLGVPADAPLLVAAGRQEPQKGFEVLLRAMPRVLEVLPETILLVAGREGRATPRLREVMDEAGVAASVRMLGHRADVPDILAAADVFVLPSHREGLPGVVLEAMALETPIVASDLPTVREAVPGDNHAVLVPPGDPESLALGITGTLTDPGGARRRAQASRRRFEAEFDIDAVCSAMARFYETALSS